MPKSTSSVGLKVALAGYDAQTAPDYDLSFSSNWPMLQVVKTLTHIVTNTEVTTPDPSFSTPESTLLLTHNLGYYAFADVWVYSNDSNFGGLVARRMNSQQTYNIYFGKNSLKLPLAYNPDYPNPVGGTGTIYYINAGEVISVKLYQFDFINDFSYAAISPPVGKSQYDPKVGLKIVRPGRNIKSRDLRDFIFHSKGSAPQLLTVQTPDNNKWGVDVNGNPAVTYQIPNGIPARIDFLYSTDNNEWSQAWGTSYTAGVYEASTGLAYYSSVYGQYDTQALGDVSYTLTNTGYFTSFGIRPPIQFSVIVRRDPLLYASPVEINI